MKPNAFLLGAPKCGTTSLAAWLADHPSIFVPHKEMHHFDVDHVWPRRPTRTEYEGFFALADPERHRIALDASVWYLHSSSAVPEIESKYQGSRFIVCVRNPVSMAPSLHQQLCFETVEDLDDFELAWRAQSDRAQGRRIPPGCVEPTQLQYHEVCALGAQVERLLERVPRHRVCFVVLDDLKDRPQETYARVLGFLGLAPDGRADLRTHNAAKVRWSPALARAVRWVGHAKHRLGFRKGLGLLDWLERRNAVPRSRPRLGPALREELVQVFASDVRRLERAIGRDLSHWTRPEVPMTAVAS